jgi:type VI secretion system protein ImpE
MDAKQLIKEGRLAEARGLLIEAVKSSPADTNSRTLLFQIQAYSGEWEKARRQLEVIGTQDAKRETGIQVYLNLIQAETERIEVFEHRRSPSFLPEAPGYAQRHESAWQQLMNQQYEEAASLFKELETRCAEISGTLNGKNFYGFRETDTCLTCFLEAFVHERYVWLPFEVLRELSLQAPQTLLDLLWAPAQVTTWDGLTLNCFLPVLYPASFRHADDRLKLGRMTDWTDLGSGFYQGVGQHVFQVGDEDIGILEIREAVFNSLKSEKNDGSGN